MRQLMVRVLLGSFMISGICSAKELKIATFNIKWFGLGGSLSGGSQNEHRDLQIKSLMRKVKMLDYDVIAFQEIVDVKRLQKKVLGKKYRCRSYDHFDKKHQHVAICYLSKYSFAKEKNETNYILEDVTLGRARSRPAVHGILKENNKPLLRVFSVHLKAFPDKSLTRRKQVKIISDYLLNQSQKIPTIVLGDFNTYNTPKNGSDIKMISKIFSNYHLKQVHNRDSFTYRNGNRASIFDHIWASKKIAKYESQSIPACQVGNKSQKGFFNSRFYNKHISDHCPVMLSFKL